LDRGDAAHLLNSASSRRGLHGDPGGSKAEDVRGLGGGGVASGARVDRDQGWAGGGGGVASSESVPFMRDLTGGGVAQGVCTIKMDLFG
jgi:hypothetical protein